ncbi:hypothetical protein [Nesterenkonia natronophila]|uniref:Uncharacterized protein n=1 Tax=Nesterenkonia natronophila TaxID=2174932 RepID=A0A3A4F0B7_9MICC|nr:hypothetical protein [Nesterenkonia natronophila]RJN31612.1 hypothetical protein D3250_05525 [Nesterenkonia natronophila]
MPWFAWIVIVAILIFGLTQVVSMATGRPLTTGSDSEEVKKLRKRIEELEASQASQEIEDRIPSKSEVNLAADDRWRIEMLEARLEEVEKNRKNKEDGEDPETDNTLT